jgi:hypothetical protein
MIDFLTSLLERNVAAAAAIRPRITSVFEPVHAPGLPAVDVAGRGEQEVFIEESPARTDRAFAVRPVSDTPARETRPLPRPRDQATHPPVSTSPSIVPPPEVVPRARRLDEDGSVKPPTVERQQDFLQAVMPRVRPPAVGRAVEDPAPVQRAISIAAPRTFETVAEHSLVVPTPIAARIAANLRGVAPNSDSGTRRRDTRIERGVSNNASPTEPTVHVTIGRIDVRAVTEAKAPARQQAASPVMGLDEYLRAHAKRSGR